MNGNVVVVGSLHLDTTYVVSRAPLGGETVQARGSRTSVGGKGGNQAVAAALAGARVSMVGQVGLDAAGSTIAGALAQHGVDISCVHTHPALPSGSALVLVEDNGENRIVVDAGASAALETSHVAACMRELPRGTVVVLQNEIDPATTAAAARVAHGLGVQVIWNAAPAPAAGQELVADADVVVVNEHELLALAATRHVSGGTTAQIVERYAAATRALVVCTVGSEGAWYSDGSRAERALAPQVQAVDTTAAGDTFVGYLAAGLAGTCRRERADRMQAAIEFAVIAASLAVTREGASPSIPPRHDVARLFA